MVLLHTILPFFLIIFYEVLKLYNQCGNLMWHENLYIISEAVFIITTLMVFAS